jgi:hypothetical protein
MKEKIGSVAV